jgi:predicted transcriptional regulator
MKTRREIEIEIIKNKGKITVSDFIKELAKQGYTPAMSTLANDLAILEAMGIITIERGVRRIEDVIIYKEESKQ